MPIHTVLTQARVPVKIYTDEVEGAAYQQLLNVANLPFIHHHVAAMPDVHYGIGATVGSVIPTHRAIIPAAVGVDIGCGMNAVRLSLNASDLPDSLAPLRAALEAAIPVGFARHHAKHAPVKACKPLAADLEILWARHPHLAKMESGHNTWVEQMGTLGGGNHFLELCLDECQQVWIMLHSGSRGIGNNIGRYFINLAKHDLEKHQQHLPDKDLAYFAEGNPNFAAYLEAVGWAQEYARRNRQEMMRLALDTLHSLLPPFTLTQEAINCHHNYVTKEHHFGADVYVTRKGAIRAGLGELGIIPGSMGAKSYIVAGKGNPESFCSCAHGAGRKLSRTAAKKRFNLDDLATQTQGVECRRDAGVLDEIPGAYKDIDRVMAHQDDLVEVRHTLKQVLCIKG